MDWKRREAPMLIASATILILTFNFFIHSGPTAGLSLQLQKAVGVIVPFGMIVGAINLILYNVTIIKKQDDNRVWSVVFLSSLCLSLILSKILPGFFDSMTSLMLFPLESTLKSFLAFYVFIVAYRAFTMPNLDAKFFVWTSILVMLGVAPIGNAIWTGFPIISSWLIDFPITGVTRGVMIGTSIASIALLFRIFIGKQRGIAGGEE